MSDKKKSEKSELLTEKSKNKREATSPLLEGNEPDCTDYSYGDLHKCSEKCSDNKTQRTNKYRNKKKQKH
jgi:hypothetical protein